MLRAHGSRTQAAAKIPPLRPHDGVCCARDVVAGPYSAEAGARAGARSARRCDAGMSESNAGDRSREPDDPQPQDPQEPSAREGLPAGAPRISLVPELMPEADLHAQLDALDVDAPA